ncbi:MAG: class I SAM-dependent methyltransferase [bacterium]
MSRADAMAIVSGTRRAYSQPQLAQAFLGRTPEISAQRTFIGKLGAASLAGVEHDVVDVGCATGADLLRFLAARLDAIGVDNSPAMKRVALEELEIPAERYWVGDVTNFAETFEPGSVKGIWCRSVLLNIPPALTGQMLAGFHETMVEGGPLMLMTKEGIGETFREDGRYERMYARREVEVVLRGAGFRVDRLQVHRDDIQRKNVSWLIAWATKI